MSCPLALAIISAEIIHTSKLSLSLEKFFVMCFAYDWLISVGEANLPDTL